MIRSIIIMAFCWLAGVADAQPVYDIIKKKPEFATCNYNLYPDSIPDNLTPAPTGKHPFYLSHYGRHGSRYINKRSAFDIPYKMMVQAAEVDELTPTGKRVFEEMNHILTSSENCWGDLTPLGRFQQFYIGERMVKRFPEIFVDSLCVDARSTIVPRCILSMESVLGGILTQNHHIDFAIDASNSTQWYMNHQDPLLRKRELTPVAQKAYNEFIEGRMGNSRLMELLFKNPDIVKDLVDESFFNYYLMKMGLFQKNINPKEDNYLMSLFTTDDYYRLWQIDNALWYLEYGFGPLNGGEYPYSQRHLLCQMIADADSCICLDHPSAQLRFGHDTVLLPLICLLGINGYDMQTTNLEEVEKRGWWCSSVFPMSSNLQLVFYRSGVDDKDVLFKVLLNEQEATLPMATDCAPYYHWNAFRKNCLKKIDSYEKRRKRQLAKK